LYRLKVDENTLKRRNVTAKPTEYMKKQMEQRKMATSRYQMAQSLNTDTTQKQQQSDFFNSEFGNDKKDTSTTAATPSQIGKVFEAQELPVDPILKKAKLYEYRPPKFF